MPIRVAGVKYIGVLSTPKIKIRAKSQDELDAQNISFENIQLPWQKTLPIEELKTFAEKIFQTDGKWPIVKDDKQVSTFDQLDKPGKSAALRMICQRKYSEQQIAFLQVTEDFASGFALTVDSFCTDGGVGANLIPYKEIQQAIIIQGSYSMKALKIFFAGSKEIFFSEYTNYRPYNAESCTKLFIDKDYDKLARFLEVAKNF